jgi:uncharacterized protein (TIGR02757 family)
MGDPQRVQLDAGALERLYLAYNRRAFVHPDPLEFLYRYDDVPDREIAGLVASSLAFGRVEQIGKSVSWVLERMDPSPFRYVTRASEDAMRSRFCGFRHRFADDANLVGLLIGVRDALGRHGSLEACFESGFDKDDETILPGLAAFGRELTQGKAGPGNPLLACPDRGSACKRLNLFLRWMVRRDDVDPGGWDGIPPGKLIVPLDTHMHRISRMFGLTTRRQADMRAALEVTEGFRAIAPDDPVRYDFCLTRLGIRGEPIGAEALARLGWSDPA